MKWGLTRQILDIVIQASLNSFGIRNLRSSYMVLGLLVSTPRDWPSRSRPSNPLWSWKTKNTTKTIKRDCQAQGPHSKQNRNSLRNQTRPRPIRSTQAPQRPGTDRNSAPNGAFPDGMHRRGTCGRRLRYLESSISVDVVLHTGDTELPAALLTKFAESGNSVVFENFQILPESI